MMNWLAFPGLLTWPWWGALLVLLLSTHVTMTAQSLYPHRSLAHRSVDFHPYISHFFRFWLWFTSGIVTHEWVAIHRLHHASVDTELDPHSPKYHGLLMMLAGGGYWLYHRATRDKKTWEKYAHGLPDDALERNLYTPHTGFGLLTFLGLVILLFGIPFGIMFWFVHMFWVPFWAAGVINGVGHYLGYRNFPTNDASSNIIPLGVFITGEELHNNHHHNPADPKFSKRWWEFDLGWAYIRVLEWFGLVKVRPVLAEVEVRLGQEYPY